MIETTEIIEEIIHSIEITAARQIVFKGEPLVESYTFLPTEEITPKLLTKSIADLIYKHFYTKHSDAKPLKISNFIRILQKANHQKSYWSKGWKIEHINADGSVLVIRNAFRKKFKPGEFIKEIPIKNLEIDSKIKAFITTDLLTQEDAFYHIYGREISDDFDEAIIRFYFNLTPPAAIRLIELLSKNLSTPFHFKCLKNPESYTRADAGVLYIDKRYFYTVLPIIKSIHAQIIDLLHEDIPLFTLKLAKGLSFGENPSDNSLSFGTLRSNLIAEFMVETHFAGYPKEAFKTEISNKIYQKGYNLTQFYLNPNSSPFPYSFD
jgi:HopA1 effector protein family